MNVWRYIAILFGSPMIWAIQITTSEGLASHACFPNEHPLAEPKTENLFFWLLGINGICMVAGFGCLWLAWYTWRSKSQTESKTSVPVFLGKLGTIVTSIFAAVIVFTVVTIFLVSPCNPVGVAS